MRSWRRRRSNRGSRLAAVGARSVADSIFKQPAIRTTPRLLFSSPREAAGRGREWGVYQFAPLAASLPRHPPPPTPPRHAQERVEGGESPCTTSRSRGVLRPSFAIKFPPSPNRGRRECRAPDAPDSRVCEGSKQRAHALVRSHRNHPAFPTQWFYGLCRTLPGDRAFLSPSPLRSLLLKNLTPASRRQDHTILPSARKRSRL
jgi:hypothetical protein